MGKGKPRWYPDKKQNKYGKECLWYEINSKGNSYCEALLMDRGNPTKICKGNRHNCCKVKFAEMQRMNDKQKINYWKKQEELKKRLKEK